MENWFEWIPACAGMTEAQPGMTGAARDDGGAVRNDEGSQFRGDYCQSLSLLRKQEPSFLRKQESRTWN